MSEEMNEIELNKQKLKTIWESIKNRKINLNESKSILKNWAEWKKNFSKDSQDNIVNLYFNVDGTPDCLVTFLRTEKGGFGGIGNPRLAHLFNKDSKFSKEQLQKAKKENELNDLVKSYFYLFKDCLNKDSLLEIDKEYEEAKNNKKNGSQLVFRKIVIMDHCSGVSPRFDLICINQTDSIDILCRKFLNEKCTDKNFFEMNGKLLKEIKEIDELKQDPEMDSLEYHLKLSSALWKLATDEDDFPTEKSPNIIFYGAPGTGKTHAVREFLDLNGFKDLDDTSTNRDDCLGCYRWVQFHPSFTYEDFIEGLKPTGISTEGSVKLELVNGVFKNFCKQALTGLGDSPDKDIPYYFIVDEINRANLSAVLGETLSLLEASYRDYALNKENAPERHLIDTQYSALERELYESVKSSDNEKKDIEENLFYDKDNPGKFGVPRNVRFIGMMNDVDKSIDAFDLALRRRFKWIRKDCDYDVIKMVLSDSKIDSDSVENYIKYCKKLNQHISGIIEKGNAVGKSLGLGKSYEFGHSFFMKITEFTTKNTISKKATEALFDNYLCPTLKEYLRSEVNSEKDLEDKLKEAKEKFTKEDKDTSQKAPGNSDDANALSEKSA